MMSGISLYVHITDCYFLRAFIVIVVCSSVFIVPSQGRLIISPSESLAYHCDSVSIRVSSTCVAYIIIIPLLGLTFTSSSLSGVTGGLFRLKLDIVSVLKVRSNPPYFFRCSSSLSGLAHNWLLIFFLYILVSTIVSWTTWFTFIVLSLPV